MNITINDEKQAVPMKMMTFDETMIWIHQMEQFGINLGLSRMEELLNRMGRPERSLKMIHVAGTNGKGSVCTFIASVLEAAGYSVGRYISPTIFDYRERIQMNGQMIEKEALAEGMSLARVCCEDMALEGLEVPTIFEIETAVGFWYFKKKCCDYVVLETGMGGRLDSTNVIEHPILNVITSISMDHMAQLGDTLYAIAGEKAGILKKGTPAVFYPQEAEAMEALFEACEKNRIIPTIADWNALIIKERQVFETEDVLEAVQTFDYKSYKNLAIHLAGTYQVKNACLAIDAIDALNLENITPECVRQGLSRAKWPGRFQCLSKQPLIYIDGAHNPDGAKSLRDSIQAYFPNYKKILVMGVFKDKDYDGILKIMSEISDTLITFTPENARGLSSSELKVSADTYFDYVQDGVSAENAIEIAKEELVKLAKEKADAESMIIIFGSLSTISRMYGIISYYSHM